jgi:hypothetical protein
MHEDLAPVVTGEEAEPLVGVKPFDLAGRHEQDLTSIGSGHPVRHTANGMYERFLGYRYHAVNGSTLIFALAPSIRYDAPRGRSPAAGWRRLGPRQSRPLTFGWCWDGIACEAVSPSTDLVSPFPRSQRTYTQRMRVKTFSNHQLANRHGDGEQPRQEPCPGSPERRRCRIGSLPNTVDVSSTAIEGSQSDIEYLRNVVDGTSSTFGT